MRNVDIAMATYNGEDYIEAQIKSIIEQSYKNWHLYIRDDNSTDKTVSIIERYEKLDERITLIRDNKGGLGVSKNFEEAIKYCNSQYIMLSDQDDYWLSTKIEHSLNYMIDCENKSNKDMPILIFSNSFFTDENLNKLNKNVYSNELKTDIKDFLFNNAGFQGASMMFNSNLKEKLYPFFDNLPVHDYHISLIAFLFGKIYYLSEPLMLYRRHSTSVTKINISYKERLLSFLKSKQILFENRHFNYLKTIYNQYKDAKNVNQESISYIEKFIELRNIEPRCKKAYKSFIWGFRLRNSRFYLCTKILFSKAYK